MAKVHETFENDARKYETLEKDVIKCLEYDAKIHDEFIKQLEGYKGKDTKSMISLMIPPSYQISKAVQFLEDELQTSDDSAEGNCDSFFWSRAWASRPSFPTVIKHAIQSLKESCSWYPYGPLPRKGLLLYCGLEVYGERKKEYMVNHLMEAPVSVKDFLYVCDDRFHVEAYKELCDSLKFHLMEERYEIFYREVEYREGVIELLDRLKGKGAKSMISLIIPPGYQKSMVVQLLEDELRTSDNNEEANCHFLWNRDGANRRSIRYLIQSLKSPFRPDVPHNGLIKFIGLTICDEESGNSRMCDYQFEPLTPVKDSLYERDDRFHMEVLKELVESWKSYVVPHLAPSKPIEMKPYEGPPLNHVVPSFRSHV